MEESAKRRERLRAMRLEADVVSSSSSSSILPTPLANPLLENPDSNVVATATTPPRFDYYTDPMAAYSADKRRLFTPRPHFSPSYGPRNHEMPLSGAHQFQNNYAPHQGTYQGDPYHSHARPGPTSSPMVIRSPYPVHQGSPNFGAAPGRGPWFNNNPSPGPPGSGGSPFPAYQGSPNFRSSPQGSGHWFNNSPSPGPGRGGGPNPGVGRERGRWDGGRMSPNSGYSGGRGRGRGYNNSQARSFYDKSMVEDPWESLTPVIWQGEKEKIISTFQLSSSTKRARVSNSFESFDASNSKKSGSLAQFLAESFDEPEAAEDAAIV